MTVLLSDLSAELKLSILKVLGSCWIKADPGQEPGEGSMLFSPEELGAQSWAFDLDFGVLTDSELRQWLEKSIRATQGEVEELMGYSPGGRLLYWGDNPEKMLKAFPDTDFRASTLCDKTFLVN
jgi:hypothetical protein